MCLFGMVRGLETGGIGYVLGILWGYMGYGMRAVSVICN